MDLIFWFALILIGGWLAGVIARALRLPEVLGMTLFGVLLALGFSQEERSVLGFVDPLVKNFALILILMRAGLGIHKATLKKIGPTALKLAIIPCVFEGLSLMVAFHYAMDFSWQAAGTVGFLLAAVSPAVVVPSMLDLKEKGVGKEKEIPTLILAGASVDDVVAITLFSLFLSGELGGSDSIFLPLLAIPKSIFLGVAGGVLLGFALIRFFSWKKFISKTVEKTLLLLGVGFCYLWLGKQYDFAALLGLMVIGFLLLQKIPAQAQEIAGQMNTTWFWAQIFLFVFIGMAVDLEVALKAGGLGLGLILFGLLYRSLGVFAATAGSALNGKERLFVALSYTPKATVQAAMGALPLAVGMPEGETILAIAVLSILFTAPMGLLLIRWGAKNLLDS